MKWMKNKDAAIPEQEAPEQADPKEAETEPVTEEPDPEAAEAEQAEEDSYPTLRQIEAELLKEKYKHNFSSAMRNTVATLIVAAAAAILIATLWLPVMQVYGNSMQPTLSRGQILVAVKNNNFDTGDVVAFYYNNKILVKRVIAQEGDWVDIDEDGNVYVNDILIDEPYLTEKSLGECNIELPYQVPAGKVFVMGDNREVSVDSRNASIGCVGTEQVLGKVKFRIWPLKEIGKLE